MSICYEYTRYYDSTIGRFLQEDPLGIAGGNTNLFQYVGNHPVNFVDPLGFSGLSDLAALAGRSLRGEQVSLLDVSEAIGRAGLGLIPGAGGLADLAALAGRSLGGEQVSLLDVSEAIGRAGLGLIPVVGGLLADLAAAAGRSLGGKQASGSELLETLGQGGLSLISNKIEGLVDLDTIGNLLGEAIRANTQRK